jgi:alkylhydroperoxidase/carboxymuconolactone decarboxylase family protein YurZ
MKLNIPVLSLHTNGAKRNGKTPEESMVLKKVFLGIP